MLKKPKLKNKVCCGENVACKFLSKNWYYFNLKSSVNNVSNHSYTRYSNIQGRMELFNKVNLIKLASANADNEEKISR